MNKLQYGSYPNNEMVAKNYKTIWSDDNVGKKMRKQSNIISKTYKNMSVAFLFLRDNFYWNVHTSFIHDLLISIPVPREHFLTNSKANILKQLSQRHNVLPTCSTQPLVGASSRGTTTQ